MGHLLRPGTSGIEAFLNQSLYAILGFLTIAVLFTALWIPSVLALAFLRSRQAIQTRCEDSCNLARFLLQGTALKLLIALFLLAMMAVLPIRWEEYPYIMLVWPICIPILWMIEPIAYLFRSKFGWKIGYFTSQILFSTTFDLIILHASTR